ELLAWIVRELALDHESAGRGVDGHGSEVGQRLGQALGVAGHYDQDTLRIEVPPADVGHVLRGDLSDLLAVAIVVLVRQVEHAQPTREAAERADGLELDEEAVGEI